MREWRPMNTFDWDAWWPGGVVLGVLAALFLWERTKTRAPGHAAFALALAIGSAIYLVKNPLLQDFGGTSVIGLGMAGLAGVAMATGMCLHTQHELRPWRKAAELASGWVLAATVLHLFGVAAPLTAHVSLALLMLLLAGMAWRARHREPGVGFGFIAAAFLIQPAVVLAGWLNGVPEVRVRLWTWVPFGIAGLTLLAVGQMRSRLALAQELQRREDAERALREANERLEQRVAERTAELHDVIEGLEAFNRTVSHDLRGPIGGIKGLAELAIGLIGQGQAERAVALLQAISRQGQASIELLASLMQLAQAQQAPLQLQPVDMDRLVAEAVETVTLARAEAARVQWAIEPLPPLPAGDPALLRQVFVNLIGNAVKFSAAASAPRVAVSGQLAETGLRVEVSDNGVGFDSQQAALFQPFRRLHGSRFEGTGIGLSIVRSIVDRHGGRVGCESRPGEGSRFWVLLPAAAPAAPQGSAQLKLSAASTEPLPS